tara:strand:+ start:284 stop:2752 length:2469 start_codon:yes stop_codon:yes gene_type:complete
VPKKVLNLTNFSGGLNDNTNARDLLVNEFQLIDGFSVERPGTLKVLGSVKNLPHVSSADEEQFASAINHGNGLFHFNSDRDPADGALANTEMLLINDIGNTKVKVFDRTDGAYETGSDIDYGSAAAKVDYYAVDGEVRVSAHDYSVTAGGPQNQNKWYGYLDKVFTYGAVAADVPVLILKQVNGFKVANQYLSPLLGDATETPDGYGYDTKDISPTVFLANRSELVFNQDIASWTVSGNTITPSGTDTLATLSDALDGHSAFATGYGTLGFWAWLDPATDTSDDAGASIFAYTGASNKRIAIFASNVYGDQESDLVHVGYISQPTVTADTKKTFNYAFIGRLPDNPRQTGINIYWAIAEDYTSSVQTNFGQKYLFFEVDFEKGYRIGGFDNWIAFGFTTHDDEDGDGTCAALSGTGDNDKYFYQTGGSWGASSSAAMKILGIQNVQSLPTDEPHIDRNRNVMGRAGTSFKTSTIINRRAYIGNIMYYDTNNKLQTANDTVLKSLVNEFDHFEFERRLDVEINDGDDIVKLASVGSKLLEFKRNTLYIINVSRDIEFLEGTLHFKGCEKDYHVVEAEGFVAWFNKYGLFVYDGESMRDLTIGENGQKKLKDWGTDYYHDNAQLGYVPEKQTLIVTNTSYDGSSDNVLEIDLKSLSFVRGKAKCTSNSITNLVNLNDGKLVWYERIGSNQELRYWNPEAGLLEGSSNLSLELTTPAYTMDLPNQDKNISTIYISYKNGDGIVVKGFTDTNDGGSAIEHDLVTLSGTNDTTYRTAKIKIRSVSTDVHDDFKRVKSFGLKFVKADSERTNFEVNDIQIVYRLKSIR